MYDIRMVCMIPQWDFISDFLKSMLEIEIVHHFSYYILINNEKILSEENLFFYLSGLDTVYTFCKDESYVLCRWKGRMRIKVDQFNFDFTDNIEPHINGTIAMCANLLTGSGNSSISMTLRQGVIQKREKCRSRILGKRVWWNRLHRGAIQRKRDRERGREREEISSSSRILIP